MENTLTLSEKLTLEAIRGLIKNHNHYRKRWALASKGHKRSGGGHYLEDMARYGAKYEAYSEALLGMLDTVEEILGVVILPDNIDSVTIQEIKEAVLNN